MTLIEVLDGGLLTTVQDLGRLGYQRYGVPTSGALDPWSLRAANRLVGNPDGAAGLEITLVGPRLAFLAPSTIALTGGDLGATIDGRPLARWESVAVEAGAVLAFGSPRDGARAWLAFAGGIDVPVVLGSRSTYTRSKLGGVEGRAIKAGDVIGTSDEVAPGPDAPRRLSSRLRPTYGRHHALRVVLGPQDDRFTAAGLQTFLASPYTVTPQSDRMGCRLTGPAIEHLRGPDIVSDGTPLGAVQVAGDGVPIVLLADRGTAGGYTKIAVVIGADLPVLAQAAAGDTVRFEAVSLEAAHEALAGREAALARIEAGGGPAAPKLDARLVRRSAQREGGRRAAAAAAAVARWLARRG